MILDYYKNYKTYVDAVPGLEEGMKFVETLLDKPVGTYRTDSEMYAMVQEGETSDISGDKMETHKKFLDVQFVFSGQEIFEWEEATQLEVREERQEISGNRRHVLHSVPSGCTPLQRQGQRDR